MLKIKFWRIEDVLLMKILEQGDEIKRNHFSFHASNGITIKSCVCPSIYDHNELYINGSSKKQDNKIVMKNYNSIEQAKDFLQMYIFAIKEYNNSLPLKKQDNIDIIIAE